MAKDQPASGGRRPELELTLLSLGILPSASSLARACRRFRIRWYCLALTYRGSSSSISAPGRGIRCIVGTVLLPGTIWTRQREATKKWREREEGVFETCVICCLYMQFLCEQWKCMSCSECMTRDPYQRASNNRQNETDGSLDNSFCNLRVLGAFSCS